MVENIGISPSTRRSSINQLLNQKVILSTDTNRTFLNFVGMASNLDEISYTTPVLRTGKPIPGRKTAAALVQLAKQEWYIEYSLTDPALNISKRRVKVRDGINHIKDYDQKLAYGEALLFNINGELAKGLHQYNQEQHAKVLSREIGITIEESLVKYNDYLIENGTRKKSIQTYMSKLNMLKAAYPTVKINSLTTEMIESFLRSAQADLTWSNVTWNAAKIILTGYFNYLIIYKLLSISPMLGITSKMVSERSTQHKAFTDGDLKVIMTYLREHDQFTLLFVQTIYYTCIRPKELRQLRLNMVNIMAKTINIPGSISKNKKTQSVSIDDKLLGELTKYDMDLYPPEWHLFSNSKSIIGRDRTGENTPYNRFMTCLEKTRLSDKGYTLYSFKHTSNINRYRAGWSVAELMKLNRHSSITQTENYLRDLQVFVDISQKSAPAI